MNNATASIIRNPTRPVRIGSVTIGNGHPIVVQSMCATKTADIEATVAQIEQLAAAGAGVVRIAVNNNRDCRALAEIRQRTRDCPNFCDSKNGTVPFAIPNLSVDLQENYLLAENAAPWIDKIRYNPGHLYHRDREKPWQDKVRFLVDVAARHDCARAWA